MGSYLDIARLGFEDDSEWVTSSSPRQLLECTYMFNVSRLIMRDNSLS